MYDSNYMLYASTAAVTADANGDAFDRLWFPHTPVVAKLAVTGTISGTSPTLDVKIQGTDDGGTNWVDIKSFPQVTGTDGAIKYIRFLCPYKQLRAVIDVGGTSPSYGSIQCSIVPAGEFTEPL